jgi:hypothetical protein
MAESAFIVRVPEAEACVSELRNRFDASVRLGVPAHITVLVNAGQEPPLFDGETAVLMHCWFSRIAPAGLSWF